MTSGNLKRILRYLEAIDSAGGRCSRMAFYNIAGNEENLRRWERKLCDEWRLVDKADHDGHISYAKSEMGENLQILLRNHDYVGSLFEELMRDRLRS